MRILSVDPGDQRIGLAISDETATIASPLTVIRHSARLLDAAQIVTVAVEQGAVRIIVGQALGDDGQSTPQSRKAERLAIAIRQQTDLPILLWDESGSTDAAREARRAMGVTRRKRSDHLDHLAAVVILQSYLDSIHAS
jgi:putative Holliday junction resolvase